jgi:hypothetical protein
MTAAELNEQAISDLGTGNLVAPREALKRQLAALLDALDRHNKGGEQVNLGDRPQLESFIDGIGGELEGFLAVALPLIEYGGETGQDAVVTALVRLAQEIERNTTTPGWESALFVIVARLVWVAGAFALACQAVELLPRLTRITVRSGYDGRDQGLLDERRARYLASYSGDARKSFEAHQLWVAELALMADRYPLLARDDELVKALMEADMLFAMHAIATGRHDGPYSHGAHQSGQPAEKRLRARVGDPRQRAVLAAFFGASEDKLQERLTALQGSLQRPAGAWTGDLPLFPVEAN